MKLTLIAGARPNFMKIAPIIHAINRAKKKGANLDYRLIHTGQHYDKKLSNYFFDDLNIPYPDVNLGVGSGSHATQTAKIMLAFEEQLKAYPTDYVLVVGDVNSTMACAIVAKKLQTKVIHVEAGLRSYDLAMPEEINRMLTDAITDVFFTTTPEAGYQLVRTGINPNHIHFVGNVMMDTLVANLDKLREPPLFKTHHLTTGSYYLMTLHRPSNVDEERRLKQLIALLSEQIENKPIIFPAHPRTQKRLATLELPQSIIVVDPLRYLEFIFLIKNAFAVLTDSGGVQEETTYLGIPCFTLRENTERPETITTGTNALVGTRAENIVKGFEILKRGQWKKGKTPVFWEGKAADRIVEKLMELA